MTMKKQWLLIVFDGRRLDRTLHSMGLRPSKRDAKQYIGFYDLDAEPQLRRHIASLKSAGMRGIAKKIPLRERPPIPSKPLQKRHRQPDNPATVTNILIAKENRLARDALKRAIERRRQADILAEREAARRAHEAVRRLKGEV